MREEQVNRQPFVPYARAGYRPLNEVIRGERQEPSKFGATKEAKLYARIIDRLSTELQKILGVEFFVQERKTLLPKHWHVILQRLQKRGLVDQYVILPSYNDYPKLHHVYLSAVPLQDGATDGTLQKNYVYNNATSDSIDVALSKTTGEFLERHALLVYKEKDLFRASYDSLKKAGTCMPLESYAENRMSDALTQDAEFLWIKGKSFNSSKDVLLPAQLVYWTYQRTHSDWQERALAESNTNGAAAGTTLESAILAGIYELIERDAFLIYWLNSLSPAVIELASIPSEKVQKLLFSFRRYGLSVYILNTMTDIHIPTCAAVVVDESGVGPKAAVGGGCASTWESAILSALGEAMSVMLGQRYAHEGGKEYAFIDSSGDAKKLGRSQRLSLWANERMYPHLQFFIRGQQSQFSELQQYEFDFETPTRELEYITGILRNTAEGYDVFYYSARNSLLDEFGFFSVKTIIPQLVPLYLREVNCPGGAKRLRDVPPRIGLPRADVLNKFPHPFP